MSFNKTTLKEKIQQIQAKIETYLPGADASLARSNLNVLSIAFAAAVQGLQSYIDYIFLQINVVTATGEHLENKGSEHGIYRKQATFATGNVTFSGTDDSTIPEATLLQRGDGVEFLTTALATIVSNVAIVPVIAVGAGTIGNSETGNKMALTSPISGVDNEAIVDASGITAGVNVEGDESFRTRILEYIQNPPHGGAANDYIHWAKSVEGVTRAWVYPEHMGAGTVGVAFVMDDKSTTIIPDTTEIEAVQTYIDKPEIRPVTATVFAFAPTPVALGLSIALNPSSPEIKTAIEAELNDFLKRKSQPGVTLYISQIREAISTATGEEDHDLVLPTANITHSATEMPTLGTITWS